MDRHLVVLYVICIVLSLLLLFNFLSDMKSEAHDGFEERDVCIDDGVASYDDCSGYLKVYPKKGLVSYEKTLHD